MNRPVPHASPTLRRRARRRRRVVSTATYHPNGSLTGFIYGNGLIHNRTLNARGLPYQIRDRNGGTSLLNYTYSYDAHGNLTGLTDTTLPGPWTESRSLAYDARDRMTLATAPGLFGEEVYDYDVLDNVRRMAVSPKPNGVYEQDYNYQYDPTNQHLTYIFEADGEPQWEFEHNSLGEIERRSSAFLQTEWTYQWDSAQRLIRSERTAPQNRVAYPLMPIFELSFLASRSLTPDGLRTDTSSALQTTWETYTYDTHGHRTLSYRSDSSSRIQVYSRTGQLLYVEDTQSGEYTDYIYLGSKLIAQRSHSTFSYPTTTYHHTDHLGSANVETDTYGNPTQRTFRMPYGAPYTGLYREGPGYTGHVTDTHTNLTYMQQRYYDPVALRFLTPDPVDVSTLNGSNFNRYWYANNNPMRFTDPDGREADDEKEPPEPPPTLFPPIIVTAPAAPISYPTSWPQPIGIPPISWPAIGRGLLWAGESFTVPLLLFYPSPIGAHPCEMPGGPPCGMMMSGSFPPGYWAGDAGAAEWGKRNGVGAREGKERFHRGVKDHTPGARGDHDFGVNPSTGEVVDQNGDPVGNLNDE